MATRPGSRTRRTSVEAGPAGRSGGRGRGGPRRGGGVRTVALTERSVARPHEVRHRSDERPEGATRSSCCAAPTPRLAPRAGPSARSPVGTATPVVASSSRTPTGSWRPTRSVRTRFMPCRPLRSATPACRPGYDVLAKTVGWELFEDRRRGGRRRRRGTRRRSRKLEARPAPSGEAHRRRSSRAPAARCSTRRAGTGSKPISWRRTRRCSAAASASASPRPGVTIIDDGSYAREWGTSAIDDEGNPTQRNVLIEDGILTDYMWDLRHARKDRRDRVGERPPAELPVPADRADDEHVSARRARTTRQPSSPDRVRGLLRQARRRVRSTRRPATSCSAWSRRT